MPAKTDKCCCACDRKGAVKECPECFGLVCDQCWDTTFRLCPFCADAELDEEREAWEEWEDGGSL